MKILLQILTIGLTGFFLYKMFKNGAMGGCCGGDHAGSGSNGGGCCSHGGDGHSHTKNYADNIEAHKDPVCGMFVTSESAVIRRISGQTYYFCSEKCAREYENN